MGYYSLKKILRHNADINIIYSTRSNGKSFAVLQNAVEDFLNGVGGFAYVRRKNDEIKKSEVDKYFRDANFLKWLEERTEKKYNCIFYKAGDLFICRKEKNVIDKDSVTLCGAAFALQSAESVKSLHFEFCYNIIYEEAITRKRYLDNEPSELEHLISTIQRNGAARLWLIGNTVSRVCPFFNYWGLPHIRTLKAGTITDYKASFKDADGNTHEVFIAVEYAENTADHSKSIAAGKSRGAINNNEWEHDEHPKLFFKLEESEVLYTCFYEHMAFVFKMQILFYNDAPYLYVYPYTRDGLRLSKNRDIFTERFETEPNRWNRCVLPQHELMRKLIRDNKLIFSDDLSGDEFLQCMKTFNPFRA